MNRLWVNEDYCKGCMICVAACPRHAIRASGRMNLRGHVLPEAEDMRRCSGCGLCEIVCPDFAIAVEVGGDAQG
jgi:2-oxoglutarate ferredoxin oxidoreductase subunit delta